MEERYGIWVSTVLSANAKLEVLLYASAFLCAYLHQLAYAALVYARKGVLWKYVQLFVPCKERAGIVATSVPSLFERSATRDMSMK